jgi:predicted O-methyltransferase YrrM
MNLRHIAGLRSLARRLPVIGAYERRLAQTTQDIEELDRAFAKYRDEHKLWAPVGNFYSPFPNLTEAERHFERLRATDSGSLPAIDLRVPQQRALLAELDEFATSLTFNETEASARADGRRYWSDNTAYGDSDARFLTAMLNHVRPARLVELGCGYSSAVTLDARERCKLPDLKISFLDPYPELLEKLLLDGDRESVEILPIGTQAVDLDLIRSLGENDVLFIDSTHVSKPGSDVNRIFFEILPAVRPGVLIHLHDIFPHFEYPETWIREQRGWTEQYVLRAFLQYNTAFEVVLWPNFLFSLAPELMVARYPDMVRNCGGAIWLRKVA